jgi:hypothetical protein
MDQRKDRRSRRALLTGAAAGAAAVAAKTLTPTPAQAADGDPVLLGQTNTSDNATTINTPFESALIGISSTDGGALVAINKFEQGYGVFASSAGIGVLARGGDTGVDAFGGVAVRAGTSDGVGVWTSTEPHKGTALQVEGRATFSRSGRAMVPAGATSVTVTGVDLTPESLVLATLQQDLGSRVFVRAAVPSVASGSFKLYLSRAAAVAAPVAWFILG